MQISRCLGPVVTIRLGLSPNLTVVISSAEAECMALKGLDVTLSGRTIYEAMRFQGDNEGSIITSQPGPEWRMLRRLCTTGFFATSRLDAMAGVRTGCVEKLLKQVSEIGSDSGLIDLGRLLYVTAFNHTGNLVLSQDILGSKEGEYLFYHAGRIMELVGKPNMADFFLFFRRVEKREKEGCGEDKKKDLLNVLLEFEGDGLEEPKKLSFDIIMKVVVEIFIAGIDTTASTMEWAMAELIRHPKTMKTAQGELRRNIRGDKEHLNEKEIMNLPYVSGVIKETLRLHPPLPFLVPHKALKSCTLLNYHVPQDTQIFVNVWAIARDPNMWEEPDEFKPERFLKENAPDFKGQHYEFLPFGSGRRKCPAVPLISRLLPLVIGSLLYHFDWKLPDGMVPEEMDMSERMTISLRKAVPLNVMAVPY
ncbi:hypothetical protein LUZ60_016306 [Juncus effusus]|nr:hypothetical protein LUZ60_016306 [Juncus effusus]